MIRVLHKNFENSFFALCIRFMHGVYSPFKYFKIGFSSFPLTGENGRFNNFYNFEFKLFGWYVIDIGLII